MTINGIDQQAIIEKLAALSGQLVALSDSAEDANSKLSDGINAAIESIEWAIIDCMVVDHV